jgi:hypothetical protein
MIIYDYGDTGRTLKRWCLLLSEALVISNARRPAACIQAWQANYRVQSDTTLGQCEKSPLLRNIKIHYRVHRSSQRSPFCATWINPQLLHMVHFYIIVPFMPIYSEWSLLWRLLTITFLRTTCPPVHPILLYSIIPIIQLFGERSRLQSFTLCGFLRFPSGQFLPVRNKTAPNTLFSDAKPIFSFNLRGQDLHPHKRAEIIMIIRRSLTMANSSQERYIGYYPMCEVYFIHDVSGVGFTPIFGWLVVMIHILLLLLLVTWGRDRKRDLLTAVFARQAVDQPGGPKMITPPGWSSN